MRGRERDERERGERERGRERDERERGEREGGRERDGQKTRFLFSRFPETRYPGSSPFSNRRRAVTRT